MKRIRRSNRTWLVCLAAALIAAFLLVPLLPGTANAAEYEENLYALNVTTGNAPGEKVSYFGLRYEDADGYTHVEYVFPYKEDKAKTLDRARKNGGVEDRLALMGELGMGSPVGYGSAEILQSGQMDTYFFEPAYEVARVTGLDIYCQGEQGQMYSWDVSGLRIYKVDRVLGVRMNGYYSNGFTVRFEGQQIAYMQERSADAGVTFSWTGNTLFRLSDQQSADEVLVFQEEAYSMTEDEYVVRMDFADIYGAGLETVSQSYSEKKSLKDAGFDNVLTMRIEYLDVFGDPCYVDIPVIDATVGWMIEQGVPSSAQIAGIAQQGETIAFGCYLRDMHRVTSVTLRTEQRESEILPKGSVEGCASITGVSVYEAGKTRVEFSFEDNAADAPRYTFGNEPVFYHTAANPGGEVIGSEDEHYITMRAYETGALLAPKAVGEWYLIQLFAEPSVLLSQPTDIRVQLQYDDIYGETKTSEKVSTKDAARDYYGYWPASQQDFAYLGQICAETGISFAVELQDVSRFNGLTISVPADSDGWNMQGVRVTRLEDAGERRCVWEDVYANGAVSNRRYDRKVEGYTVFNMEEKTLIQSGTSYEINFISNDVHELEDVDWETIRYSMSYDQCTSSLGFTKSREHYVVEVHVGSGGAALDGYGDTGSKNRFYFLLEFENGSSGYVLANQQLGSDGFRSGCVESFVISTNYDYGELVAVHIIPDDISEGSDPYDKLNVEQISVRDTSNSSATRQWVIDNVGWIGIDYRDDGASSAISGQGGRSEMELARIFPVSYKTYAINLEFLISTGVYAEGHNGSFYGTMEATLEYYNAEGQRKQVTFDVIRAMYDYANKSPIYQSSGEVGTSGEPLAVSDPSFMFRENHTDRFRFSVSDLVKLDSITLRIKSFDGGTLAINEFAVAMIGEEGRLSINEENEYVYTGKTEYLCGDSIDKIPAYYLQLITNRVTTQTIYFTDHEQIKLDTEGHTWISAVSREPVSKNDTINLYIFPASDANGVFTIDASVQFTDVTGRLLENGAKNLAKSVSGDGKTIFYATGLNASGMSTLNKIYIKAQSPQPVNAYIDQVVVQRVRSGVVIGTYVMDCDHRNADMEFFVQPGIMQPATTEKQVVNLLLGNETVNANLVSENRDVAVAIRYTTRNDAEKVEYTSKYIYLTDQQIWSVRAGDLVSLTFNEAFVDEVVGIQLITTDNVAVQVDKACVDIYQVNAYTGEEDRTARVAFDTMPRAQNNLVSARPSDEIQLQLLDVEFITAGVDAQLESGTTDPISMVIGYTDRFGIDRQMAISDIRALVVSAGEPFATGTTTRIRLMLCDVAKLRWVRMIPYDNSPDSVAGWKLEKIKLTMDTGEETITISRVVNLYIQENDAPEQSKISLVNLVVTGDIKASLASGAYGISQRGSSVGKNELTVTAVSKGTVLLSNLVVTNSNQGCIVTVLDPVGEAVGYLLSGNLEKMIFSVPENITGSDVCYKITVASAENNSFFFVVNVVVPSEEQEPTEPAEGEQTEEPTEPAEGEQTEEPTEPAEGEQTEESTEPAEDEQTEEPTEPAEGEQTADDKEQTP